MKYPSKSLRPELEFICAFALEEDLEPEVSREQLRSLWTAYCIHAEYECDTCGYDNDIRDVWHAVTQNETNPWNADVPDEDVEEGTEPGFDQFDNFMCENLV